MTYCCTLCGAEAVSHFHTDKRREYVQCSVCHLVFVPEAFYLNREDEKAMYDNHDNNIEDLGYQRFLQRVIDPLVEQITPNSSGLDFGCGPGPALAHMLTEQGYEMNVYDIFYAPDKTVLQQQYDFVTCTEVIEHFNQPAKEWPILLSLVKSGGVLALMTKLVIDHARFLNWHYKNDPTHVSFFSRATFEFLAKRDNLMVEFVGNDVIIFKKP